MVAHPHVRVRPARRRLAGLACALLAAAAAPAFASNGPAPVAFDSWLAFQGAAVAGTDYFGDLPSSQQITGPLTRYGLIDIYTITAAGGDFFATPAPADHWTTPMDHWLSTWAPASAITFTFASPQQSAFGGDFFVESADGSLATGHSISIVATDWTGHTTTRRIADPDERSFTGFTDAGLRSVTISLVDDGQLGDAYVVASDVQVGHALAVPEPSAALLMAAGLLGMTTLSRRRRPSAPDRRV